jgi:hypothetical protein
MKTIQSIKTAGNTIMPAISLAHAYTAASRTFTNAGIYFNGLDSSFEVSENGAVVYSVYPRNDQSKKLYFIF